MARIRPIKTNFTNGEVDPLITMRSDLELFANGAAKMRNALPFPQGGFRRWDGLEFMTQIPPTDDPTPIGVVDLIIDIATAGTGYAVNDIMSVDGGVVLDTSPARVQVEKVVGGAITALILLDSGIYSTGPASQQGLTNISSSGSDAEVIFSLETQDVVQLVDFTFSVDQNYLIVFTVSRFYIFRKEETGGIPNKEVFQGLHPYNNQDLEEFTWTQSLDVMLIFHEAHPIFQLTRIADSSWTFAPFTLTNIPSFAFGEVQTSDLSVDLPTTPKVGDSATITSTGSDFPEAAVGNYIRIFGSADSSGEDNSSYYKIITRTSFSIVVAEILILPVTTTDPVEVNGVEWLEEEPSWSAARGYPRAGTFFQGRLVIAGSGQRPNTLFTSRAGDINDFNNGGLADDLGITVTADSGEISTFQKIYPGRHLQIFSDSAEFYVPISEAEPITPSTISLRRTTSVGGIQGIPVFEVDGAVYFIQRGGRSMRQFVFVDGEKAYSADTVSLFSSHLIRNPRDAAFKKSLNTEDGNYIWVTNREDGTLAAFSLLRSELINAWALRTTDGAFHHVAVLDQTSYFHMKRSPGGTDIDTIEFFNKDLRFDSGVFVTGLSSGISSVSDLDWLADETVELIIDDIFYGSFDVSAGGDLTFPVEAQSSYQFGLPFPDIEGEETGTNVLVETLPADVLLAEGSKMGKKKRIVTCALRFIDTQGFYVQNIFVPFRTLPEVLGVPIPTQSGDKELKGLLGWNDLGQIKITQKEPMAMTILGMAYDLSTG